MLELYLIRHGVAAERGSAFPDDSKRPLTKDGINRMRDVARGLEELGVDFDQIIASPLVRARQTAEVIADTLESHPPVVTSDSLTPGGASAALFQELSRHPKATRFALVGHEPDMGELAGRLIGARKPLPFKKGGICRIDVEELPPKAAGELQWFATPKMLRGLAK